MGSTVADLIESQRYGPLVPAAEHVARTEGVTSACPRCAQSAEDRKRDHKTKHIQGCANAKRSIGAQNVLATAPAPVTPRDTSKRITQQVREGLMGVFELLGGETALLAWARDNPTRFFEMWARSAPREDNAGGKPNIVVVLPTVDQYEKRVRDARVISTQ
jgi:hypothetical protein